MLRDYIELPLPVRILCFGSLINRAGSFVLVFLTIYASEEMGFGIGFATACMGVLGLGSMLGSMLGGQLADPVGIALFCDRLEHHVDENRSPSTTATPVTAATAFRRVRKRLVIETVG